MQVICGNWYSPQSLLDLQDDLHYVLSVAVSMQSVPEKTTSGSVAGVAKCVADPRSFSHCLFFAMGNTRPCGKWTRQHVFKYSKLAGYSHL